MDYAQHDPNHRVYMGDYPVAIQSSDINPQGDGVTLRRPSYRITHLRRKESSTRLIPRLYPRVEPRASSSRTADGGDSVPRVRCRRCMYRVYPGWYSRRHTREATYPAMVLGSTQGGIYTRVYHRVYIGVYTFHTRVYIGVYTSHTRGVHRLSLPYPGVYIGYPSHTQGCVRCVPLSYPGVCKVCTALIPRVEASAQTALLSGWKPLRRLLFVFSHSLGETSAQSAPSSSGGC